MDEKGATIHFVGTEKTVTIDKEGARELRAAMADENIDIARTTLNFDNMTIIGRNITTIKWHI